MDDIRQLETLYSPLSRLTTYSRVRYDRRLDQVADPTDREQAAQIRTWFMGAFLRETDDFNRLD